MSIRVNYMELFDYTDYKRFVRDWIASQPGGGRGQARQIALHLKVGSVFISQVFSGKRDLSVEQAFELTTYLELSSLQAKYFVLLVQQNRAGTKKLQDHYEDQLEEMRASSRELKNRVKVDRRLSQDAAATYYSSWVYSGVRLATSIPELQQLQKIADHLKISMTQAQTVMEFLLQEGLCTQNQGKYEIGGRTTHLGADSPLSARIHANWRLKAMPKMDSIAPHEIFYTSPVSLAKKDLPEVRKMIVSLVEKYSALVKDSPSETLACLSIDWFSW